MELVRTCFLGLRPGSAETMFPFPPPSGSVHERAAWFAALLFASNNIRFSLVKAHIVLLLVVLLFS